MLFVSFIYISRFFVWHFGHISLLHLSVRPTFNTFHPRLSLPLLTFFTSVPFLDFVCFSLTALTAHSHRPWITCIATVFFIATSNPRTFCCSTTRSRSPTMVRRNPKHFLMSFYAIISQMVCKYTIFDTFDCMLFSTIRNMRMCRVNGLVLFSQITPFQFNGLAFFISLIFDF
jgi:hypothetical protein